MTSSLRPICLGILLAGLTFFSTPAPAQDTNSAPATAAPAPADTAESWVKAGVASGMKGDLQSAISNFNQAIKIDPNYAVAYQCRGHAMILEGRLDDAIADFNQAIKINPNELDAYYDRGVARAEKDDFDGALADFSKAVELNPKYAAAYYNLGHVKYFKGDLDGASNAIDQAITLNPNPPLTYFIRGMIRLSKDDREGAAADFQQSATNGYPNAAFWLWIVQMRMGEHGVAQGALSDFLSKPQLFNPDAWPTPIGNFLLGKITQDQLLAKAVEGPPNPTHTCDAWFYIGMSQRFSGDTKGALVSFQKAIATGTKTSEMYIEAGRQIAALQKN